MNRVNHAMESAIEGGPTLGLFLTALVGLVVWFGVRRWIRGRFGWAGFAARAVAASAAAGLILRAAASVILFETPWPWLIFAGAAGTGAEGLAVLYARELNGVGPVERRRLTLLRTLAFWTVLLVLLQPVWVRTRNRHVARRVTVLVDDSASMHFTDRLWTTGEKLDVAEAFGTLDPSDRFFREADVLAEAQHALQEARRSDSRSEGDASWIQPVETARDALAVWKKQVSAWIEGDENAAAAVRLQRTLSDTAAPALDAPLAMNPDVADAERHRILDLAREALTAVESAWLAARPPADAYVWQRLDDARRSTVEALCATNRAALAWNLLIGKHGNEKSFLDRLAERYDVDVWRFGRRAERWKASAPHAPAQNDGDMRSLTDMTHALETVLHKIPGEEWAGALIVGDGLHNSPSGIEAVSHRLALQGTRVSGLLVGGSQGPFDLALADVRAPDSVYLGDSMRMRVVVQASGARDRTFGIRLLLDGETVDEQTLTAPSDDWRHELRLVHEPKGEGVFRYAVQVDILDGELFEENNAWSVDVAVSDERTHVLLVDSVPRWEFRYLRNLFYGRDQSVHLQYWLTQPDMLADANPVVLPPASAHRAFGDAESGGWPASREEWEAFDVIILGDVEPKSLTAGVLEDIRHVVQERGALLVLIAGRRAMPHAFADGVLPELAPIEYRASHDPWLRAPEPAWRLALTPAGRTHPVMQQSASASENDAVWRSLPEMRWRFPVDDVKPGAEILAYAHPLADDAFAGTDATESFGIEKTAARLERMLDLQRRHALIVAGHSGRGRVLMLCFDRTWRMRYREGDTYHHRFWGQAIRWGAGEMLRGGNDELRVGTDQWRYEREDTVRVTARLTETVARKDAPDRLQARIVLGGSDKALFALEPREGVPGVYDGEAGPFEATGHYDLFVSAGDPTEEGQAARTSFSVVAAASPVEMARVSADAAVMRRAAEATGGTVVDPSRIDRLLTAFGDGSRRVGETIERPLWSSAWLFAWVLMLLAAEWLLRKKKGLP